MCECDLFVLCAIYAIRCVKIVPKMNAFGESMNVAATTMDISTTLVTVSMMVLQQHQIANIMIPKTTIQRHICMSVVSDGGGGSGNFNSFLLRSGT